MEWVTQQTARLDCYADQVPQIKAFARNNGVSSGIVLAVPLLITTIILLAVTDFVTIFVTVCVPMWKTFRALESDCQITQKLWLTFWVAYGVLEFLETNFAIIFYFIPFWRMLRFYLFKEMIFGGGKEFVLNLITQFYAKHRERFLMELANLEEVFKPLRDEAISLIDKFLTLTYYKWKSQQPGQQPGQQSELINPQEYPQDQTSTLGGEFVGTPKSAPKKLKKKKCLQQ